MSFDSAIGYGEWTAAEVAAQEDGRTARRRGLDRLSNPYRYADGTDRCAAWDFGWWEEDEAQRRASQGQARP